MCKELEQTFLQRRQANGQQTHEQMLNVTDHQGNVSPNPDTVSLPRAHQGSRPGGMRAENNRC